VKPVVGLTVNFIGPDEEKCPSRFGSYYLNRGYVDGVVRAGGIPVALPHLHDADDVAALIGAIDALILTGGKDMDPTHFGEPPHPSCERILPDRSASDIGLVRLAVDRRMPVLGICLGLQTLNVAMGGTLWQDLPSQHPGPVDHRQGEAERTRVAHTVDVVEGSLLHRVMGSRRLHVNSVHHQAVREVGRDLVVSALAPDGLVEGLEHPGVPFCLTVQWHPEDLREGEPNQALFDAVVEAARAFRA
jgi:putative glutamine amidotransferase